MSLMTFAEYARHYGCAKSYITKIRKAGMLDAALVEQNGARYPKVDSEIADKVLKEAKDPNYGKGSPEADVKGLTGGQNTPDSPLESLSKGDQTFLKARVMTETYKAADRKLVFEIKSGRWIEKSIIREQLFKASRIFRDNLLNIGPRIAAMVVAEKNETKVLQILQKEHSQALKDLISDLDKAGV